MRYWLMKSEPEAYGIDDLARDKVTAWWGVRNYQARNFMRDQMRLGDRGFFYHSNCAEPGIVGIVEVCEAGLPRRHPVRQEAQVLRPEVLAGRSALAERGREAGEEDAAGGLAELRSHKELANMRVLAKGNRLSITPVDPAEWTFITEQSDGQRQ
jgi:predicted RNA-binding protein with PUA-like domain